MSSYISRNISDYDRSEQRTTAKSAQQILQGELTRELARYNELRTEEINLRARVRFLEKKAAQYGPLKLEVDLAMLLEQETAELSKKRHELELLESQLQTHEDIPPEERNKIITAQLEQLLNDVTAKREQVLQYQQNISYLENRKAELGSNAGIDLVNEIELTKKELADVETELSEITEQMKKQWDVDLSTIANLAKMNTKELQALAFELMDKEGREIKSITNQLIELRSNIDRTRKLKPEADLLVDQLCIWLAHKNEGIRLEVIEILGMLGTERAIQVLVAHIQKNKLA